MALHSFGILPRDLCRFKLASLRNKAKEFVVQNPCLNVNKLCVQLCFCCSTARRVYSISIDAIVENNVEDWKNLRAYTHAYLNSNPYWKGAFTYNVQLFEWCAMVDVLRFIHVRIMWVQTEYVKDTLHIRASTAIFVGSKSTTNNVLLRNSNQHEVHVHLQVAFAQWYASVTNLPGGTVVYVNGWELPGRSECCWRAWSADRCTWKNRGFSWRDLQAHIARWFQLCMHIRTCIRPWLFLMVQPSYACFKVFSPPV